MTTRTATCRCGQLRVACDGDPVRAAICHCFNCQKRTGSIFGAQARFRAEQVTVEGNVSQWSGAGDSGTAVTFNFCPVCGSTLFWVLAGPPGFIAIAVGAFADPSFPPPVLSVYEERAHPWVQAIKDLPMERWG